MEKLKSASGVAAGYLLLFVFLSIPIFFLLGAAEFSVWALDWIPGAFAIALGAFVLLMPLAIIPASRGLAANLFSITSLVFGACLWLYTLAFTYLEWGMLAVVIGVMLAGVGVIFTGILAAIFAGSGQRGFTIRDVRRLSLLECLVGSSSRAAAYARVCTQNPFQSNAYPKFGRIACLERACEKPIRNSPRMASQRRPGGRIPDISRDLPASPTLGCHRAGRSPASSTRRSPRLTGRSRRR